MVPIDLNAASQPPYNESANPAAFANNLNGAGNIPGEFGHHCRNATPATAEQEDEHIRRALATSLLTAQEDACLRQASAESLLAAQEDEQLRQALAASLAIRVQSPATPDPQAITQAKGMPALEAHLAATGYRIRDSDGKGNNCLFYSIVQCILPSNTDQDFIARDAAELREQYDILKPGNEGQGLFFDNNQVKNQAGLQDSDNASVITDLVCQFYDSDVLIELIAAPIGQDDQPYISMGKYRQKQPVGPKPAHHIRVLDTYGHYKSIIKIPTPA